MSFNEIAEQYDRFRPSYPVDLISTLISKMKLNPGARVLEIGAGTGKATELLLPYKLQLSCLEPGRTLARMLRQRFGRSLPGQVGVIEQTFEDYSMAGAAFEAIVAAQCFHWLSPQIRLEKCHKLLVANGGLALFWNLSPRTNAAFFQALYQLYDTLADGMREPTHVDRLPNEVVIEAGEELLQSALYGDTALLRFPWTAQYSSAEFLGLIDTYSNHRALPVKTRKHLYQEVSKLCGEFGPIITKEYVAVLYLGHAL